MIQNLLRIIIVALVLASFLVPAFYYSQLPDEIPIHFNAAGVADGFGKKSTIWLLPILNVVNLIIIFAISRGTKHFQKKKTAPLFPEIVGIYLMLITCYLGIANVLIAIGEQKTLGTWFLPFIIFLTILLVGYIFIAQRKLKKEKNSNN